MKCRSLSHKCSLLLAFVCLAALVVVGGSQFAIVKAQIVKAQIGNAPSPPPFRESVAVPDGGSLLLAGNKIPRQIMMQMVIMEVDAAKLAEANFDLARELGVERGPQPDPQTRPPLVARLGDRELRLLTRSLTLAEAVKVLSRPALVTLDGQLATVHAGGEVPLIEIEQVVNGKRESKLESRAFGTLVELTPRFVGGKTWEIQWNAESSRLEREHEELHRLVARALRGKETVDMGESLVVADVPVVAAEGKTEAGLLLVITPEAVEAGTPPAVSQRDLEVADRVVALDAAKANAQTPNRTASTTLPAAKRIVELPLEGDLDANLLKSVKAGQRVKLVGRERLADGGLGEEEHVVFEPGVVVQGVQVTDGRAVLLLQLSAKEAERLQLAREHCQLSLSLPSTDKRVLSFTQPERYPTTGSATSTPPASSQPDDPLPRSEPASLREELQSLREDVQGLRKEVERVVELLERRQSSNGSRALDVYRTIRGAGQEFRTNPVSPYATPAATPLERAD
jgi:hypothetical protein